jgi:hypothetical protein
MCNCCRRRLLCVAGSFRQAIPNMGLMKLRPLPGRFAFKLITAFFLSLAVGERRALALRVYIGLERAHLVDVWRQHFALYGIFDALVNHVPQQRYATELYLKFRISLGMRVRGIRMTVVARHADFAA